MDHNTVDHLEKSFTDRLNERGVKKWQLPFLILGHTFRFIDKVPRPHDGVISRDKDQNERSLLYGYSATAVIAVGALAGVIALTSDNKTRDCAIEQLTEEGFNEVDTHVVYPYQSEQYERAVIPCIPIDVQDSDAVSREAVLALNQMGIQVEFAID